ncbi:MAG: AbrB/MazE/SpoVT family DNA-binding domain-containing protein [Candidatus Spechtbacteria bacterium]|nr:AbrB/MazE/SpoVT family DNA-binding domain-containing protein [Candidatus Spechtbacteria bacterium]
MTQKVLKVGDSAAVTIPKKSLEDLGISFGDHVRVEIDKKRGAVIIMPLLRIDKELIAWTKAFIEKYRPALEALAKK